MTGFFYDPDGQILGQAGGDDPPPGGEFAVVRDEYGHYLDFSTKWRAAVDMVWDNGGLDHDAELVEGPFSGLLNAIHFKSGTDPMVSDPNTPIQLLGWNTERYVEKIFFIKTDEIVTGSEYVALLWETFNADNGYRIGVELIVGTDGTSNILAFHDSGTRYNFSSTVNIPNDNAWRQVVVVFDHGTSANPTIIIEVNGTRESGFPGSVQIAASTYDEFYWSKDAGIAPNLKGVKLALPVMTRQITSNTDLVNMRNAVDIDAFIDVVKGLTNVVHFWLNTEPPITPPDPSTLGDGYVHDISINTNHAVAYTADLNRVPVGAGPIDLSNYYAFRNGCVAEAERAWSFMDWGHSVNFWFKWNGANATVKNDWVIRIESDTGGGYMQLELHDTGTAQFMRQVLKPDNGDPIEQSQTQNLTTLFDGNWHKITWFTGNILSQWRMYYDDIDYTPAGFGNPPAQAGNIVNYKFGNIDADLAMMMFTDVYDSSLPPNLTTFTNEATVMTYARDNNYNACWRMQNLLKGSLA
jgi:hypothetical protein